MVFKLNSDPEWNWVSKWCFKHGKLLALKNDAQDISSGVLSWKVVATRCWRDQICVFSAGVSEDPISPCIYPKHYPYILSLLLLLNLIQCERIKLVCILRDKTFFKVFFDMSLMTKNFSNLKLQFLNWAKVWKNMEFCCI